MTLYISTHHPITSFSPNIPNFPSLPYKYSHLSNLSLSTPNMKRQRRVEGLDGEETARNGKKKPKNDVDVKAQVSEKQEEEGKQVMGLGLGLVGMGTEGNENAIMGWDNDWEENWVWPCSWLDDPMSFGSIWLPFWDMDFMGDPFTALYNDVVWDDDIWNLKNQIPDPFQS